MINRHQQLYLWFGIATMLMVSACSQRESDLVIDKYSILEKTNVLSAEKWGHGNAFEFDLLERMRAVLSESTIDTVYVEASTGRLVAFDLLLESSLPGVARVVYNSNNEVDRIDFYGLLDTDLKRRFLPSSSFTFFNDGQRDYVFDGFREVLYRAEPDSQFQRLDEGLR